MSILKNFSFNKSASAAPLVPFGLGGMTRWLQQSIPAWRRKPLAGGVLEHLATLPLNTQASLVLVRLGHETLLLGATAQQIRLIAKQPADRSGSAATDPEATSTRGPA